MGLERFSFLLWLHFHCLNWGEREKNWGTRIASIQHTSLRFFNWICGSKLLKFFFIVDWVLCYSFFVIFPAIYHLSTSFSLFFFSFFFSWGAVAFITIDSYQGVVKIPYCNSYAHLILPPSSVFPGDHPSCPNFPFFFFFSPLFLCFDHSWLSSCVVTD